MTFEGRQALVTGGSSGIGLAIAKGLRGEGCAVHLVARDRKKLEAARKELTEASDGAAVTVHPCDVTQQTKVDRLFARLEDDGTRPTILINSAGISLPGYFEALSTADFERMMSVNFFGTLYTTRAIVPFLVDRGDGYIVNLSSVAGMMGVFGYTGYCASKFAVTGFTEALRAELSSRGVCVSLVCPGDVDTPMLTGEAERLPPETRALNASAGVIPPEAVAGAVLSGMRSRRALIIPGRDARTVLAAHRYAPRLVEKIIQSKIEKTRS